MAGLTPEELLQIHKDYADQFASIAQSGLAAAFGALSNSGIFDYHPTGISIRFPDFGTPNPVGALPSLPKDPKLPTLGALNKFVILPNPTGAAAGAGPANTTGGVPVYNAPATPPLVRDFTAIEPASPTNPTLPFAPSYLPLPSLTLPFTTFITPTAPTITNPTFDGQRPLPIAVPDGNTIVGIYNTEQNTHRAFLPGFMQGNADAFISKYVPEFAALRQRINNAITAYTDPTTGGGNSVPVNIENAIMARSSDRTSLEAQRTIDDVASSLSKKGWTMPGGALLDAIRQAKVGMGDAQVRSSTDVATKNLELEQQNFQFMLKLGEALEEKMIDTVSTYLKLSLEIDAQAINSAKELIAAYIGAYNLQVLVYKTLWDGYQADAEVLKARIAANESLVRIYEAQIKAEMTKAEVNTAQVGVLRAVADVNLATANTYKAQIDAAMAPLEVARLQIAIYELKAKAYASEVAAYEARWRGYDAQVNGELAKFKGYEAQVAGYTAQIQAFRAQIEAYTAQVNAAAETNRAVGQSNESTVRVYSAQADAAIKVFDGQVAGFSAVSGSVIKQAEIEVEYWRTKSNLIFQEFNVAVQQMFEYSREQMNLFRGQMEAAINAANGLAHASQVAGNLAGGAMQGLTTFAGVLESKTG